MSENRLNGLAMLAVHRNVKDEIIDNELETNFRSNDIGLFTNCTLTDADKKLVLRNVWVPNVNYEFPLLEKYKARGLKFQYKWFTEFNWLVYSEIKQGVFCKYCLLFAKYGGIGGQPLGQLVSTAFSNWKKAKETFRNHSKLKYHLSSVLDADHFLTILDHKQVTIIEKLVTNRTEQIKLNRSRLIPIIECVILCGQQEIALRGHRDSGKINGNY
ncbi:zinc finger MYM-type protein 1-like [Acyrthosiphon pisum]|uniref:TTF-type domain-containing protein n=1 Tax=Acyrthosiphon pisum TaxID=7029 RepID=A0A8R2NWQ4_ACYPI|nr:zinc finger MYM-type protein 1-like [Acyrthosiphon pisum]